MVAAQDFQKVVFDAGSFSYLVKEPCGAVLAVDVLYLGKTPCLAVSRLTARTPRSCPTSKERQACRAPRQEHRNNWLRDGTCLRPQACPNACMRNASCHQRPRYKLSSKRIWVAYRVNNNLVLSVFVYRPSECHVIIVLKGINTPINIDIYNTFEVYFQIFRNFGYKELKNSDNLTYLTSICIFSRA